MSRITDIAKTMKTWWNEDDDPYVHRVLDEIIRIDQEQAPTIEPKRGKWITYYPIMMSIEDQKFYGAQNPTEPIPDKRFPRIKCSVCGGAHPLGEDNFCPNCGAKMKGEDDETISR